DLNYDEDKDAAVDMNIVMTSTGLFVEVQGAGEEAAFSAGELHRMIELGQIGIQRLIASQRELLRSAMPDIPDL
ncbi:MAG: ribonuclease PH, partial [Verrucomicrobia bacterium]|nr:ribonuclease PH [Verrucomicrobiota bacterium]